MKSIQPLGIILSILVMILTACSIAQNPGETSTTVPTAEEEVTRETPAGTGSEQANSQCEDPFDGRNPTFQTSGWETNFCLHSVPYDEISSGGPPRDGIPPLDNPRFETISSADEWIEDLEPIILLDYQGEARAYPLQIMTWHEIVNDEIAGDPVLVTFCPLCNTALIFHRPTIEGEVLTFGTSGNLRYSDLVMWDRQTESWWQQFNGEAIVGDLTGTRLEPLPAAIISWLDFKTNYPNGQVLSVNTGFNRSYGRNPYAGYDNINNFPFAFQGNLDGELPPMARVVGVLLETGESSAYTRELIQEEMALNEQVGDTPIAILWKPGTASALDSGSISAGRDIGTSAVYQRVHKGQELTFSANEDGTFTDQETGSTWDILGRALEGPLAGEQLTAVPHHDTFWFAWAAFVPDSGLSQSGSD